MDSDSELSFEDQITLIKMLESNDLETTRLALTIVDIYKKPVEMACKQRFFGSIIFNIPFDYLVRSAANFELNGLAPDGWINDNREMLIRLLSY